MNFDNPVVRIIGYIVFSVVVFLAALLITFPQAQIEKIAAVKIEKQAENTFKKNLEVEVGDVDLWWMLGLELENIRIREPVPDKSDSDGSDDTTKAAPKDGKAKGKQAAPTGLETEPMDLEIESVAGRLAPISSALNLGLSAKFHLGFGDRSITGTYSPAKQGPRITAWVNDVKLDDVELLEELTGIPFGGTLSGKVDLVFRAGRGTVDDGTISLTATDLQLGPKRELDIGTSFIKIPRTNFGTLKAEMHLEKTDAGRPVVKIDNFRSSGQNVDVQTHLWGDIRLANSLARAEARLRLRGKLNPEFLQKNELTSVQQMPAFRNGKKGNWYGFVIWGPLGGPNFKGSPQAADGPNKGAGDGAMPPGGPGTQNGQNSGRPPGRRPTRTGRPKDQANPNDSR